MQGRVRGPSFSQDGPGGGAQEQVQRWGGEEGEGKQRFFQMMSIRISRHVYFK